MPQITGRCLATGNDFIGILVSQLIERKLDHSGDTSALFKQITRIHMLQNRQGPQMALAVRVQQMSCRIDCDAFTNCRERILQHAS